MENHLLGDLIAVVALAVTTVTLLSLPVLIGA